MKRLVLLAALAAIILPKAGDGYFHLTREYALGEGKLFRLESREGRLSS